MCCACALFQDKNKTTWLRLDSLSGDSKFIEQRHPLKKTSPSPRGIQMPLREQHGQGSQCLRIPCATGNKCVGWEGSADKGGRQARVELWPRKTARGKEPLFWAAEHQGDTELCALHAKDKFPTFPFLCKDPIELSTGGVEGDLFHPSPRQSLLAHWSQLVLERKSCLCFSYQRISSPFSLLQIPTFFPNGNSSD